MSEEEKCEHGVPVNMKCAPCLLVETAMQKQIRLAAEEAAKNSLAAAEKEKKQAEAHKIMESNGGDTMTPSEAIQGFLLMLESQPQLIQFSKRHRKPSTDELLKKFCQVNNLKLPREHWRSLVTIATLNWRDKS